MCVLPYVPTDVVVTFAPTMYSVVEGETTVVRLNSTTQAETEYTIQVVQVDGRKRAFTRTEHCAIIGTYLKFQSRAHQML